MKRLLCFLLLLTLVPLSFTPNAAAQSTTYTETFESPDLNGDPPEEDWYSFVTEGTGTFRIATDQFKVGAQSYRQSSSSGTTVGVWTIDPDLCAAGTTPIFTFWWRAASLAGSHRVLYFSDPGFTDFVEIVKEVNTGVITAIVNGDGTPTSATLYNAVVVDTWYQFEVRFTDCSAGRVTFFIKNSAGSEIGSVLVDENSAILSQSKVRVEATVNGFVWVDEITITGAEDEQTVITADATASVTGLVGFDVDPTGGIAIARTASGENVLVYSAQNLGTAISPTIDTNCATGANPYEDAVMAKSLFTGAGSQLVAFLSCTVGGDSNQFQIRQANGDPPTEDDFDGCQPAAVAGGDVCVYDIPLDEFEEPIESALGQLGQIQDWPIDFSRRDTSFFGLDNRYITWAFATQQCNNPPGPSHCDGTENGEVGVVAVTTQGAEGNNVDKVQQIPNQDVSDFCVGLDGTQYYIGASGEGQPARTWRFNLDIDNSGFAFLDVDIVEPGSTMHSSTLGIACGGGQVLVEADTTYLHTRQGAFLDSIEFTGTQVRRGLALSDEFVHSTDPDLDSDSCSTATEGTNDCVQYGVAVRGTTAHVLNLTGGVIQELATITLPSGTFHSVFMDRTAQNVWIATSTNIARYSVLAVTTIDPVSQIPPEDGPGDVDSDDGLFSSSGETLGNAIGTSTFGGNLILGALLMGIVAYGVGTGYGNVMDNQSMQPRAFRVNPWAAAVGAAVGFLLAWGFGFFDTATVFAMVVLVGLVVGVRMWVSR